MPPVPPVTGLFLNLPFDVIDRILSFLSRRDLKQVRLTCKRIESCVRIFDRVYVSTNRINLEVMYSIAENPKLREQVPELVFDDFRIPGIDSPKRKIGLGPNSEELFQEQKSIMEAGEDRVAFRFALNTFSNLRKVAVTSSTEAHSEQEIAGLVTPFHRKNFEFSYPRCYSWLGIEAERTHYHYPLFPWENVKHHYWGYLIAVEDFWQQSKRQELGNSPLKQTVI